MGVFGFVLQSIVGIQINDPHCVGRKRRNLVPQKLDTSGGNGMGREQKCFLHRRTVALQDCFGKCLNAFMNEKPTRRDVQSGTMRRHAWITDRG